MHALRNLRACVLRSQPARAVCGFSCPHQQCTADANADAGVILIALGRPAWACVLRWWEPGLGEDALVRGSGGARELTGVRYGR